MRYASFEMLKIIFVQHGNSQLYQSEVTNIKIESVGFLRLFVHASHFGVELLSYLEIWWSLLEQQHDNPELRPEGRAAVLHASLPFH